MNFVNNKKIQYLSYFLLYRLNNQVNMKSQYNQERVTYIMK